MDSPQTFKNIPQISILNEYSAIEAEDIVNSTQQDSELLESIAAIIQADAQEKYIDQPRYQVYRFLFKSLLTIILSVFIYNQVNYMIKTTVQTIFSTERIEDPIIMDLLSHKVMERIKNIDQSGPLRYFDYVPAYSKYEHSLGVWALLKHYNIPLQEQVAGLLHDVSHTVFSHVGDYIFEMPEGMTSYQDTIHLDYLEKQDVLSIIKKYNITLGDVIKKDKYKALEQELPNICADRIEYILHTGVLYNKISKADVKDIMRDLYFEKGQWYFSKEKSALKFAELSLLLTENFWGAAWNLVLNYHFSELLKAAVMESIITIDDIHYGNDKEVLQKLFRSSSKNIQKRLVQCRNVQSSFQITETNNYDIHLIAKFRGIDPYIKNGVQLQRLTEINPEYRRKFDRLKENCAKGYRVRFIR